jgi:hypothetical protein
MVHSHELPDNHITTTGTDGLSTPKKNPDPIPQNKKMTAEYPPKGFMCGHIFIRAKNNPTRFKIKTPNGKLYDYEGTPKEGDHLRRLAPVIFRHSNLSTRAEEVSEITNPKQYLSLAPLEGILTAIDRDRGVGEIAVTRMDGTHDISPFKFFIHNLDDSNTQLPKKGAHVLFKTGFATGSRLDKQGRSVGPQRYINIVHITDNTHALRTKDKNITNPELLKLLRTKLNITLEVGTEPVHSTFTTLTALQALTLEEEDLPHTIEHMHEAARNHCTKHKNIPEHTASSSSTDPPNPLTPIEQALLKQARAVRHTLDKPQPINILIKPQAWQHKDTAEKWIRHINFTLASDETFAQKIGKIYLIEQAAIDTNINTIISTNPQIITRPIHSTLPNHVHRILYIDTPTHEGEWTDGAVEYARARNCHKYIIHEFKKEEAHFIPVTKILTMTMNETTDDDTSQATMGPAPITQLTIHHPTRDIARSTAAQQALEEYEDYPYQTIEQYTPMLNWKKYVIDAPIDKHKLILTHLNSHQAGITAMSEAEFQNAGNDTNTLITLITQPNKAGHTVTLAITNLLATDNDKEKPTPAHAYTTSPHSITISTPLHTDDIELRLSLYKAEMGEDFPFRAFLYQDDANKPQLCWVTQEQEKLAGVQGRPYPGNPRQHRQTGADLQPLPHREGGGPTGRLGPRHNRSLRHQGLGVPRKN